LVEFFRQQPGFRRLLGQPLDRDQMRQQGRESSSEGSSEAAADTLKRLMARRRQPRNHHAAN
jgi:hypothetical protein